MPRRIPDYYESFAPWNTVSSVGSLISVIATAIFFYIIYRTFADKVTLGSDYWYESDFYDTSLEVENISKGTANLESTLTSPPEFHTYNEIPNGKDYIKK